MFIELNHYNAKLTYQVRADEIVWIRTAHGKTTYSKVCVGPNMVLKVEEEADWIKEQAEEARRKDFREPARALDDDIGYLDR